MQITSTLLSDAVIFARSQPGMVQALLKADNDIQHFYAIEVGCRVLQRPGDPNHFFLRVIFFYTSFDAGVQPPHFFCDVAPQPSGGFIVLPPQSQPTNFGASPTK
jgi:hypothetical protein